MKVAIIDLGTNTFHLLLAETNGKDKWKKILHKRITVKLGQGGINNKIIGKVPYGRGIKALSIFKQIISEYKIKSVHAYGTAALRTADNGADFLKEIQTKFKINIQLISGSREAELIYLGVQQAVQLGDKPSLIMDIGGGSVEFIIADKYKIFTKQSFKTGAALLLDKFKPSDPLRKADVKAINNFFEEILSPVFVAINKYKPTQLIGSAGSFETFASMIRYLYPESGSHYGKSEHDIKIAHFDSLFKSLIHSSFSDRNQMKGLIKMRIDMIVLAAMLLNFVLKKSRIKNLKLSSYSLKEGILVDLMQNQLV